MTPGSMILHPAVPVLWVAVLHLAAWGAGSAFQGWWRKGSEVSASSAFLTQMLGFALLAQGALLLIVLRGLYLPMVLVLVAVGAASGALRLRQTRLARPRIGADLLPALAAWLFWGSFLPAALWPLLHHDDATYHLLLPRLYLEQHGLLDLPGFLYAHMPHLVEVLYTLALACGDLTAPKVLNWSLTGWILVGFWGFAAPRLGRLGAGLVLLLLLSGRNLQWHLGPAYVEPVLGAWLLAALLALVRWTEKRDISSAVLLGLFCGCAAAGKYTAWLFGGVLLGVATILMLALEWSGRGARLAATTLVVAALPVLPWLIKNGALTGNPVYPSFYSLLGGDHWSELQDYHAKLRVEAGGGGSHRSPGDLLALPYRLVVQDGRYACPAFSASAMVLLLLGLVTSWGRQVGQRWLPMTALAGLALWALAAPQGRYLVAWLPVLVAGAALSLAPLRSSPRGLWAVVVLTLGVGLWQTGWQGDGYQGPWQILSRSRSQWLEENPTWAVSRLLNETLPGDAKVAAFWENRLVFLDRPFLADSVYQAPSLLAELRALGDPAAFAARLAERGVSHALIHGPQMQVYFGDQYPGMTLVHPVLYPEDALGHDEELLRTFVRDHLELLVEHGSWGVFRLRGDEPEREIRARGSMRSGSIPDPGGPVTH